jgi:hypothetical protein
MTTQYSRLAATRGKNCFPAAPQTGLFPAPHTLFFIGGKYSAPDAFLSAVKTLSSAPFGGRIGNA